MKVPSCSDRRPWQPRPEGATIPVMKKLLILAILVALGVVAAKRLRPS